MVLYRSPHDSGVTRSGTATLRQGEVAALRRGEATVRDQERGRDRDCPLRVSDERGNDREIEEEDTVA